MEYTLINMESDARNRENVVVITFDPGNFIRIHNITVRITGKMLSLIKQAETSPLGEFFIPIATLPPENGSSGAEFYVKAGMFVMLKPLFADIVWNCIHDEAGNELD